jgi:WD40 repeat protein
MTSSLPQSPDPITVLRGHKEAVNCLSFINKLNIDNDNINELLLASGSSDGQLILWNIESRKPIISLSAHKHSIISLNILSNKSSSFASSGRDGMVRIWDTMNLSNNKFDEPISTLNTGAFHFCNSSCAKNKLNNNNNCDYDNLIATPSGNESEILLWDIRISKAVAAIPSTGHGMLTSLQVNASTNIDDNIDSIANNTTNNLKKDNMQESNLDLLAGYEDGSITLFDMKTLKPRHISLPFHDGNPILTMDISNNGKYIMTGGADNSLNKLKINNNNNNNNLLFNKDDIVKKESTNIPLPGKILN